VFERKLIEWKNFGKPRLPSKLDGVVGNCGSMEIYARSTLKFG
jgi:hypothetical protein